MRAAGATVETEVNRPRVHGQDLRLERVARLEQRLVVRVLAPAEEQRADDAPVLFGEVAELDRRRGAEVLGAIRARVRADAAEQRIREAFAIERRAAEL